MNKYFKIYLSILVTFLLVHSNTILAQEIVPSGINYQAVARDKDGKLMADKSLIIEIDLINILTNEVAYSERHEIRTNKLGLFTLVIGKGSITGKGEVNDFSKIDWGKGTLKVAALVDLGNGFQSMGEIVFQAVPYAYIADSALKAPIPQMKLEDLVNVNAAGLSKYKFLVWDGNNWSPTNNIKANHFEAEQITLNKNLQVGGNIFVTDTLTTNNLFSQNAVFDNIKVVGNQEFKGSVSVSNTIIAGGNIETGDTIKAKYFKIENIEGYLKGKVSDLSDHTITELKGVSDTGSGRIITNYERTLLLSLPNKMSSDSIHFEDKINLVIDNHYYDIIWTSKAIDSLKNTSAAQLQKLTFDSLYFEGKINKEVIERQKFFNETDSLINEEADKRMSDVKILNGRIINEVKIRYAQDSIINNQLSLKIGEVTNQINIESESRRNSDSILQVSINNEELSRVKNFNALTQKIDSIQENYELPVKVLSVKVSSDSLIFRKLLQQEKNDWSIADSILFINLSNTDELQLQKNAEIDSAINTEKASRIKSDYDIAQLINNNQNNIVLALAKETIQREDAIKLINDSLKAEAQVRISENISLLDSLRAESSLREQNVETLNFKIQQDSISLSQAVNNETNLREKADNDLKNLIVSEKDLRINENIKLSEDIDLEELKRSASDIKLSNRINADSLAIRLLISNLLANSDLKIENIKTTINSEITDRISNDKSILDSIKKEFLIRKTIDDSLSFKIKEDSIQFANKLADEINARNVADVILQNTVNSESSARSSAISVLANSIDNLDNRLSLDLNSLSNRISADSLATNSLLVLNTIKDNTQDASLQSEISNREIQDILIRNKIKADSTYLKNLIFVSTGNQFNTGLTLTGNQLSITDPGSTLQVDLSSINTDNQSVDYDEITHILTLQNGGAVNLSGLLNDDDADSLNEINQELKLNGTILEITDVGGKKSVNLNALNTDNQNLSFNTTNYLLTISNGNTVNLSDLLNDADSSKTNELNTSLTLTGTYLEITDAGGLKSVNLSSLNTDNQQLSLNGNILSIENANTITIPYATNTQNGLLSSSDWSRFDSKQDKSLSNGKIWIGNPANIASPVTIGGEAKLLNDGSLLINNGVITDSKIANSTINGNKLASMGASVGHVLKYDGNQWTPGTDDNTIYSAGTGISVVGTTINNTAPDKTIILTSGTGISVSGTYPNFTITNLLPNISHTGDVTGSSILTIADNAVTASKIANGSVTNSKIAANTISLDKLSTTGVSNGQVIKFVGGQWVSSTDQNNIYTAGNSGINISASNTISNTMTVVAGNGISVSGTYPNYIINNLSATHTGDVTGTVNLTLKSKIVTSDKLGDTAVSTVKIKDAAIIASKLASMGATNGQVLKYNGSAWVPSADNNTTYVANTSGTGLTIAGNVITNTLPDKTVVLTPASGSGIKITSAYPNFTIDDTLTHTGDVTGYRKLTITPRTVTAEKLASMGALNGQILKYNGSAWAPASDNNTTYSAGTGMSLSGTTFNNLITVTAGTNITISGTYPEFKVNNSSPNATHTGDVSGSVTLTINDNVIKNSYLKDKIITSNKLDDASVTIEKLSSMGAINGQILKYNGIAWTPANDNNTTYSAGTGLSLSGTTFNNLITVTAGTGVTITGTYPEFRVNNSSPNASHTGDVSGSSTLIINDNVIKNSYLKDKIITSNKLDDASVTIEKLSSMGALNGQILKYNGSAWAPAKDENTTYTAGAGISITGTTIANTKPDQTVTLTAGTGITVSGTYPSFTLTHLAHTGDVAGSTSLAIQANAVTTTKIADLNVTQAKIANGSINAQKLDKTGALDGNVFRYDAATSSWKLSPDNSHKHVSADITDAKSTYTVGDVNKIVIRDANGYFEAKKIKADVFDGKANTADKLANARTISLSGFVTGSTSFDGGSNVTINTNPTFTTSNSIPRWSTTTNKFEPSSFLDNGTNIAAGPSSITSTIKMELESSLATTLKAKNTASSGKAIWGNASGTEGYAGYFEGKGYYSGTLEVGATTTDVTSHLYISSGRNKALWSKVTSAGGYAGYFEGQGYFSGKVGIGATPNATSLLYINSTAVNENALNINVTGTGSLAAYLNGKTQLMGNVGILKAPTTNALDVNGTVNATSFVGPLTGNASSATKLATARTIALSGNVSGSASFDGSGNISIATTESDPEVNMTTDKRIPRWNSATSKLENGSILDDGTRLAIGSTTINNNVKLEINTSSEYALKITNTATTGGYALYSEYTGSNGYAGYFKGNVNTTGNVSMDGTITIKGGNPGTGKVLTSDNNGNASWVPASLPSTGVLLSETQTNYKLSEAGYNCIGRVSYTENEPLDPITNDTWATINNTYYGSAMSGRIGFCYVWTGSKFIIWGGIQGGTTVAAGFITGSGMIYDYATDTWNTLNSSNESRVYASSVFTGTEMITWGGKSTLTTRSLGGTRLNLSTQQFSSLSASLQYQPSGAEGHIAVWTGKEMIIWGGISTTGTYEKTGSRFNPTSTSWSPMATCPLSARAYASAVWTGTELIVWGGKDASAYFSDGAKYNPTTNSWSSIITSDNVQRAYHTAVWTGTEMIVWGGRNTGALNSGFIYYPAENRSKIIETSGVPAARYNHTAVWTGSDMIIFGGNSGSAKLADPGIYNPLTGWGTVANTSLSLREYHAAVWTGDKMILYSGTDGTNLLKDGMKVSFKGYPQFSSTSKTNYYYLFKKK